MKEQKIKEIIDSYLSSLVKVEANRLPGQIEVEMSDTDQDPDEEWRIWYPINSKVTNSELEDFENKIGYKLPDDYKIFLKHKHFYELYMSEMLFCKHPVNTWQTEQIKNIFDTYAPEYLIAKGYLPFADWSDWGVLCFDTNRNKEDCNYPIVLWDHEVFDEVEDHATNFFDMITELYEDRKKGKTDSWR
jgi:hypothetical protein